MTTTDPPSPPAAPDPLRDLKLTCMNNLLTPWRNACTSRTC